MCYSHATSLYLHNMSDRIPLVYDITVPYNYSGNLLDNENVSLRYVKDDIFKLGMTDIKTINNLTANFRYDIISVRHNFILFTHHKYVVFLF